MKNSVINKVIPSLIVGGIVGLLGLFIDVQATKAQVSANAEQIGVSHKNNKLICLMSVKLEMKKEDVERFCVKY